MTDFAEHRSFAEKACGYLTGSPDPFFAVRNGVTMLEAAGYSRLSKRDPFTGKIEPGGKYFYTVNKTALVAFAVGGQCKAGNGIKIIGGHTDSPNLKVKPRSKRTASGCIQLGVECYGGGLWHTWLDRDLGISGRVLVRDGDKIVQRLVKIDKPIARVSTLCIHLQTREEMAALKVNKEDHMSPIIATQPTTDDAKTALEKELKEQLAGGDDAWMDGHEPLLMKLLAEELGVEARDIADMELNMFDTQGATLGGINDEFIYSARLDNLATCFVSLEALIAHSSNSEDLSVDEDVSLVALFDHEEVGSESAEGAGSPIMVEAVKRISTALNGGVMNPDLYGSAARKSFILSVDQAHAEHPNYSAKHEKNHAPRMNAGLVIKSNSNQRYTTNSVTRLIVRDICRKVAVPVQEFVVRNDCPCGSTIGPILSTATGIRSIDAGMAQLSMHSCREVMGVADLTNGFKCFKAFFKYFNEIDKSLEG